jgi:membrane protein implicated in regulation of membrane protease activity
MPTRADGGVQAAVHEVADHARALVRLEAELAKLELRDKAAVLGAGAVLLVTAAILGLFALGFLLAAAAAGLATFLPTWLALLIVGGALLLLAVALAAIGRARLRSAVPPVPEQALAEARLTGSELAGQIGG